MELPSSADVSDLPSEGDGHKVLDRVGTFIWEGLEMEATAVHE